MVPIDLRYRNERALRMALALARQSRAHVTLFHVIAGVPGIRAGELQRFFGQLVKRSERWLREAARRFGDAGIRVGTEVRVGVPAAEIVRAASGKRVDLVVMGSHRVLTVAGTPAGEPLA
jgi:nucleotide-binding universal stress UspA family protein